MATVYLDHLIERDALQYVDQRAVENAASERKFQIADFRLRDMGEEWFYKLRKPDFQRETNYWTPEQCAIFIESVARGDLIPGIIAWRNFEAGRVYIIDGAHRLSVVRAWMQDDWGDKSIEYYNEADREEIEEAANEVRALVSERVGSYKELASAYNQATAPLMPQAGRKPVDSSRRPITERESQQFKTYNEILTGRTLSTQWVEGSYEEAQRSFININTGGARISQFELMLHTYRNGPFARVVSSIINAGKTGHFWPNKGLTPQLDTKIQTFSQYANAIHEILFRPPFEERIENLNQPLIVTRPGYRYEQVVDLVGLLSEGLFLDSDTERRDCLSRLSGADSQSVITKADGIFEIVLDRLSQLVGSNANPKTMSIVPLVYTYNHQGIYSRNLFYAILYWLFTGNDEAVRKKKIAFSAIRGNFESILVDYKAQMTGIASKKGAGFKSTKDIASVIDTLVRLLVDNIGSTPANLHNLVADKVGFEPMGTRNLAGRTASRSQKNQVNIENILSNCVRCHICGGVLDLARAKQYDHYLEPFSKVRSTSTENLKPAHPFCNHAKEAIEEIRRGAPAHIPDLAESRQTAGASKQLGLFG
ncbi:DUF262 domain-containing protein [Corallococcus sp. AB018]|uniref:HNH endonuclease family protein n=1 Tax=Corallococcus sp. AB018 TaxID=2316715 RepID=UPI001315A14B|nr:DUF262 domain-containing protein [Corallococcus sp. AB018]